MIKPKTDKNVTLIAVNTTVDGQIRYSGELYVNGTIVGDILTEKGTQSVLVISEEGSVKGEIRVPTVVIRGGVEGDVHADAGIQLGKKAHVRGDLHYKLIEVESGAIIDGQLVPTKETTANVHALPVGDREDDDSEAPTRRH